MRTADELIAAVSKRYATLDVYADRGEMVAFVGRRFSFDTTFVRNQSFTFSASDWHRDRLAHVNRISKIGDHLELGDQHGWKGGRPESLASAVAALTGVTLGLAHRIPKLLMPSEVSGRALSEHPTSGIRRAELGDRPHFVVQLGPPRSERLWIDESSLLIRRIDDDAGAETNYVVSAALPERDEP